MTRAKPSYLYPPRRRSGSERKNVVVWKMADGTRRTVCDRHVRELPGNRQFVERFADGWCDVCTPDIKRALRDER
jgi:hypothetical protein